MDGESCLKGTSLEEVRGGRCALESAEAAVAAAGLGFVALDGGRCEDTMVTWDEAEESLDKDWLLSAVAVLILGGAAVCRSRPRLP